MKYINEFSINENKKSPISFTVHFHLGDGDKVYGMYLYALAKNSKQLDKLYGQDKLKISDKIKSVIEKKSGLEVSWVSDDPGAGYWFRIYPSSIEKLLGIKNIKINV